MTMTLKHRSSFFDSPVMRELERQAFAKDEDKYKISSAARAIKSEKEAIPAPSYEPTDDVLSDLVNLASGLRDKGLVKEAESLEEKIANYKVAEVHMYRVHDEDGEDLLDQAHKEGDVELAPSSKGYGKVETLQSASRKIKEIVMKRPTGKQASLEAVAEALEVPLKKKVYAQVTAESVAEKTQQDQEALNGIFSSLVENTDALKALLDPNKFGFTYKSLLARPDHQTAFNNITANKYKWFLDRINAAKNAGIDPSTPESILQSIRNKVDVGFAGRSDEGKQVAKNILTNVIGAKAATGEESAQHIAGYIDNWRKTLESVVPTYNKHIKNAINLVIKELHNLRTSAAQSAQLDGTVKSYNDAIKKIYKLQLALSNINWKGYVKPTMPFHTVGFNAGIEQLREIYKNILDAGTKGRTALSNLVPGKTGRKISERIVGARDAYREAANAWSSSLRAIQEGTLDEAKAGDESTINANRIDSIQLASMMEEALREDLTVGQLINNFNKEVDGVNVGSEEDILEHANGWRAFAEGKAVTAGIKTEITKLASIKKEAISGMPRDPHSGKKQAPRGGALAQKPTKVPTKAPAKFDEQPVVSMMQRTMSALANALFNMRQDLTYNDKTIPIADLKKMSALMGRTGYGTRTPFDGKWGTNTQAALKQIQNFANQLGIPTKLDTGVYWSKGRPVGENVAAKAKANADAVAEIMSQAGLGTPEGYTPKAKEEAVELFDTLPFSAINKDPKTLAYTDELRSGQIAEADKPLYPGAMDSLYEFYSFLDRNNIYANRASDLGFTIGEWDQIFNWFRKRSGHLYDAAMKDRKGVKMKRAYMDAVNKLYRMYSGLRKGMINANPGKEPKDIVIPPDVLQRMDAGVAKARGGALEQKGVGLEGLADIDEGVDWNRSGTTRNRLSALTSPFSLDNPLNILALTRAWRNYGANIKYMDQYEQLASDTGIMYDTFNGGNIDSLASLMTRSSVAGDTLVPRKQIQNFRNMLIYFSRDMKEIYRAFMQGKGPKMQGAPTAAMRADVQRGFERWFNLIRETSRRADVYQGLGRRRRYRG